MDKIQRALRHVRRFHPEVVQVFFGVDGRWRYMDEDMEAPVFDRRVDVGILEDAADDVEVFPAAFRIQGP